MDVIATGLSVSPDSAPLEGPSSSSVSASASAQVRNLRQRYRPVSHRLNVSIFQVASRSVRDEACASFLVLITCWIFACLTVILGFYGSSNIDLGPNSSILLHANPFFVQSIKAKELQESKHKSMLYGFNEPPPLDVKVNWSETHNTYVESGGHKEWQYFLNKGSKVNISYSVKRPSSSALSLVIAEGRVSLFDWIEDPSYTTLSWDIIHGNGILEKEISSPTTYFIALRNLNFKEVEVQLNFTIEALIYNATQANYKCSLSQQPCTLKLSYMGNAAVLTSPGPELGMPNYIWHVELYYGHRWISYFVGSAYVSVLIMIVMKICFTFRIIGEYETGYQAGGGAPERAPLLSQKDDDLSSCGSCESLSTDEDELNESLSLDGKQVARGESDQDKRRLCIICLEALRDCFFLPCGHCAACFTCGTRVMEEAGKCLVCHRTMKKVRKIFSV